MSPKSSPSPAGRKFPINPLILARVAPFGLYMIFIGVNEGLHYLISLGFFTLSPETFLFLYIPRIVATAALLWYFRADYPELRWSDLRQGLPTLFSFAVGLGVFALWIRMTWPFAVFGTLNAYDPASIQPASLYIIFIAFRLLGSSIIVPIMEELFWRSFIVRYIIRTDFDQVPIGVFTLTSFCISAVLFGMEHNLWLAGIMAGSLYNLLLYKTRSIAQCILAHAVTNGILGCYVLTMHSWIFW
ncbi:MAG: CAAX prenyl protease-related protein [Desulfocapsaceae bacterium]|nr:CAAX prenyl protease-related protein [Desulfocapsaceae bacterium]